MVLAASRRSSPDVYINVVSRAAVYGIIAVSMNVLVGYAGQASLGHAAFLGVGAFASGYALTELGMPFGAALVVAALVGMAAALVLGGVALRVTGLYLALVTIAFGLVRAGDAVQHPVPHRRRRRPAGRPAVDCSGRRRATPTSASACWRSCSCSTGGSRPRRPGRAIQALRDDERVAASWGIDVTGHKLLAFVISGGIAGIAGGLFASIEQIVSKEDFGLSLSITFLLMTVVGGAGNRWGVVQGGVLFAVLPTLLDRAHENFHVFPFTELDGHVGAGHRRHPPAPHPHDVPRRHRPAAGRAPQLARRRPVQARPGRAHAGAGRRHGCPPLTPRHTDRPRDRRRRRSASAACRR